MRSRASWQQIVLEAAQDGAEHLAVVCVGILKPDACVQR